MAEKKAATEEKVEKKTATKSSKKPAETATKKASDKPAKKPASAAAEKPAKKPAEKKVEKVEEKKETKKATKKEPSFLMYKGRPLVRSKNMIYYGNMSDDYVAMFMIMSTTESHGMQIAEKVKIQIISTDATKNPMEMIIRTGDAIGLMNAMELGSIWLERALAGRLSAE